MRLMIGSFLLALLTSCAPHIDHFTASPQSSCPGDQIMLGWKVTGARNDRATIFAAPPGAAGGFPMPVAAEDHQPAVITSPTTFTLAATNEHGTSSQPVNVARMLPGDPPITQTLADIHSCPTLTAFPPPASVALAPGFASPRFRLASAPVPWGSPDVVIFGVSGPGVGEAPDRPWSIDWQYTGPNCPQPGATSSSKPVFDPPPVSVLLTVTLTCAP